MPAVAPAKKTRPFIAPIAKLPVPMGLSSGDLLGIMFPTYLNSTSSKSPAPGLANNRGINKPDIPATFLPH